MYQGIIFDLDGTLLNTEKDIQEAINFVLNEMGAEISTWKDYLSCRSVENFMSRFFPEKYRNQEGLKKAFFLFKECYEKSHFKNTFLYDGIAELLTELEIRRIPMSILSNQEDFFVQKIAKHFFSDWNFVCISGKVENHKRKPDPSLAKVIAKKMNLLPQDLISIGDSMDDVVMAKKAHFSSGFALWGFFPEDLDESKPQHVFKQAQDVLSLFS